MPHRRYETNAPPVHSRERWRHRAALVLALIVLQPVSGSGAEELPANPQPAGVSDSGKAEAFRSAMSDGLAALAVGRPGTASGFFKRAKTLRPNDPAARDGAQQADLAILVGSLRARKKRAEEFEAREEWAKAAEEYRGALAKDSRLVFAKQGLRRSEERYALLTEIKSLTSDPARLETRAVLERARALVRRGDAAATEGTPTYQSTRELENLLGQASTPIPLTLLSDGQTEVVVYKVGNLGSFAKRELSLRPGTYTLIGSRDGYRDVRMEIRIRSGETPKPVTVISREPLQ